MLYLALFLPRLALDLAAQRHASAPSEPWVIVDRSHRPESLYACNDVALAAGLAPGMRLSAALALAADLRVDSRQPDEEKAALQRLAAWAQQFTPTVIVQEPQALLLEIGGCLAYFKGLRRLRARVEQGLHDLGYHVDSACAPSCLAALWLAGQGSREAVRSTADLPSALSPLPVACLDLPAAQQEKLQLMGLRTLGQLLQLPRAGLARRFGSELSLRLDQALALQPDPRPAFEAPPRFHSRLELAWAADHCADLLLVLRRMLIELCGYLAGRGLGVQSVSLLLEHENRSRTPLELGFGKPARHADSLFAIARERLERFELPAPVAAVSLHAEQLHSLDGHMHDLFGHGRREADLDLLHARLAARLGQDAVCGVASHADHRPEKAWCRIEAGGPTPPSAALPQGARPAWLLDPPQPLPLFEERPWYGEPLSCLGRAERIDSGWWDGDAVRRDYFLARGPSGRLLWIFQDRADQQWFLHGLFD